MRFSAAGAEIILDFDRDEDAILGVGFQMTAQADERPFLRVHEARLPPAGRTHGEAQRLVFTRWTGYDIIDFDIAHILANLRGKCAD